MRISSALMIVVYGVLGGFAAWAAGVNGESMARYGLGAWPEPGRGNHRALVRVADSADAVRVHIPWRRRDPHPEQKAVHVFAAGKDSPIQNVAVFNISRQSGDVAFQPLAGPGVYEIYYLPFQPPPGSGVFGDGGHYDPPKNTADPAWLKRHGLDTPGLLADAFAKLPEATVVEIQARNSFSRMDPMEVVAEPAEVQSLLGRFPDRPVLLFPEDRRHPVKMFEAIPQRWAVRGPQTAFVGKAQPGEFYVFQIGVWACRRPVTGLDVRFEPLHGPNGAIIAASGFRCFNLGGTDWRGRPLRKKFTLAQGLVRAFWIGVQIPRTASAGTYTGRAIVTPNGMPPVPIDLTLDVAGPVLDDGGVSDLWRMARLRWLDSTLGIDDDVVAPYTPLTVKGNTVGCLGRAVRLGLLGLPEDIHSFGHAVLAGPVRFKVKLERGRLRIKSVHARWLKRSPGIVEREVRTESPELITTLHARMEFDGCLLYRVTLEARKDVGLGDVRLEAPVNPAIAEYMMGMGRRGGYRPKKWDWKWTIDHADNMVWLGNADAGLQLKLAGNKDVWESRDLREMGLPASWHNGGAGGCRIREQDGAVRLEAFSGPRRMKAGENLTFRFRFLITPFHPTDPENWNWRYGNIHSGDGNILHLHHGTTQNPYINYPFLTVDKLKALVREVRSDRFRKVEKGALAYPAPGNIRLDRGALYVWVRGLFDPRKGRPRDASYNQSLFYCDFPNQDQIGFYWNVDDRGMRAYLRRGAPEQNRYPVLFGTHSPDWRPGQRHLLTLSWGSKLAVAVDGKVLAAVKHNGTLAEDLHDAVLNFRGAGFAVDAVKITDIPFSPGQNIAPVLDAHTLLLDTFSKWDGGPLTQPEKCATSAGGRIGGRVDRAEGLSGPELHFGFRKEKLPPAGINIYYTVRELSNHVAEMWALHSLGDEIFKTGGVDIFGDPHAIDKPCKGYSWLREHLVTGYETAWRVNFGDDFDAAIQMQGLSRWHNYYVEGLQWLMQNTGVDGLYLDGIGYDRGIMQRVAKVMRRTNPRSRINFHSGDAWSPPWDRGRHISAANLYMGHLPYISNLWFGELFDYNMPPDYWLVEISGIPFGLTGEMLQYQNGGNPYRGMIYGMVGRMHPSKQALWRLWDDFGIQDAKMIGYWEKSCPVRTDTPEVLATAYVKPGEKTLIALAHWPTKGSERRRATVPCTRKSPVIDGQLTPGEWEQAAGLSNFRVFGRDAPADPQTQVFATWDAKALYIAFRCRQAPGVRPTAKVSDRDGPVWEDDAVELFFQPDPNKPRYFQLVGNSRGTFADCAGTDRSWNGTWTYRASVGKDAWTGELRVPFSTLGIERAPGNGHFILGFNACRDRHTPGTELSCWAPVSSSFHEPRHFGRLLLAPIGAAPTREKLGAGPNVEPIPVSLKIDWAALGLAPAAVRCTAPAIAHFQAAAEYPAGAPIPIGPGKGQILILEPVRSQAGAGAPGPGAER